MHDVFGGFSLDTARYEFRRSGDVAPLRSQVFDVLAYLVTDHERVVSRDKLLEQVWPEQLIAESTRTSCIKVVRQAWGDTGCTQHPIQTVHGRGCRSLAPVTWLKPAALEAPLVAVVPVQETALSLDDAEPEREHPK